MQDDEEKMRRNKAKERIKEIKKVVGEALENEAQGVWKSSLAMEG